MHIEQVSNHCYAIVNPKNRLCDSNSGFINAGDGVVVDTQCDLGHAAQLLQLVKDVSGRDPRRVINTHEDSDHVWGNQLFEHAEIIGHRSIPERMQHVADPKNIQKLTRAARTPLQRLLLKLTRPGLLSLADQLNEDYDFAGIVPTPPDTLFERQLTVTASPLTIELTHVGPCHQLGDTIVHVPEEGVVFAGDLVFSGCTPMGWCGTFENWSKALDTIIALKPASIVPGHGPICDIADVVRMKDYLQHVYANARAGFERGKSGAEVAAQIDLTAFRDWNAPARVSMNVERAYREFAGRPIEQPWDVASVFQQMYRLAKRAGLSTEF